MYRQRSLTYHILAFAIAVLAMGAFADAMGVGDVLPLALPGGASVRLTMRERMPSPLGGDVFVADVDGLAGVRDAIVLSTDAGVMVDMQDFLNRKVYKIAMDADGVKVDVTESMGRGRCGSCGLGVAAPEEGDAGAAVPMLMSTLAASSVYVDILVAYDRRAAEWADVNGGGITNFAQVAVQKLNLAISSTDLDSTFRFRLVGVTRVETSSSDFDAVLDAVTSGKGAWAAVKKARDKVGADIVTVLLDTGSAYGTTGMGWSLKTTSFAAFSEHAYNVCAVRSVAISHTMTHEIGHNLGAGHSEKIAYKSERGPQLYKYSAGSYMEGWFPVAEGNTRMEYRRLHTIMAYDQDGYGNMYEEVPYFSSPNHVYELNGVAVPVGDSLHDNTRTLRNTCIAASKWRAQKVPEGSSITLPPDQEGDSSVALWPKTTPSLIGALHFSGELMVALTADSPDAIILYTLDGSEPRRGFATVYDGPFFLGDTALVKAVALVPGADMPSTVSEGMYVCDAPTENTGGGTTTMFAARAGRGSPVYGALVRWDPVEGASTYGVLRGDTEYISSATLIGETSQCRYWDASSTSGEKYWYWIKAVDSNGRTRYSNGVQAGVEYVTVGFDAGGGEASVTRLVAKGYAIGALPRPSWQGHFFEGWWWPEAQGGARATGDEIVEDDMVLHARWTESLFETGGDVCWEHEGGDRYRSGAAADDQATWIEATAQGAGVLSFRWKVSSEKGYDFIRLYIDDVLVASASGNLNWTARSVDVHGAGPHTFRWEYAKDGIVADGSDCAWLEGFAWTPRDEISAVALREHSGTKGTVAISPKNGLVQRGGTATLTAKAGNKNTAFAYWVDEAGKIVGYTSKLTVKASGDRNYCAVFRLKNKCVRPVFDMELPYGADGYASDNSMVGVAFKAQMTVNREAYPVKFSAKGLPKGLKINATTGNISGVPTKAGTFTATITVKSAANTKLKASVKKLKIVIAALPAWARGSFAGATYPTGGTPVATAAGQDFCACNGLATISVGKTGKISGKVTAGGTNWTFSASCWSAASVTDGAATYADRCSFVASGTAVRKVGKKKYKKAWRVELKGVVPTDVDVTAGTPTNVPDAGRPAGATVASGSLGDLAFEAQRNFWSDTSAAGMLKGWTGAYRWFTPKGEALTLSLDAKGGVKVTGTVDGGRKLSITTRLVLRCIGNDMPLYAVYIYAPKATVTTKNKKGKVISKKTYPEFVATVLLGNTQGETVDGGGIAYRR